VVILTDSQQHALKDREIRAHPFGARREFAEKHLNWTFFSRRINLKKLTTKEATAFRDMLTEYADRLTQKRHGPTRRSIRRKAAVVAAFLDRGAVDRLGDVIS